MYFVIDLYLLGTNISSYKSCTCFGGDSMASRNVLGKGHSNASVRLCLHLIRKVNWFFTRANFFMPFLRRYENFTFARSER